MRFPNKTKPDTTNDLKNPKEPSKKQRSRSVIYLKNANLLTDKSSDCTKNI